MNEIYVVLSDICLITLGICVFSIMVVGTVMVIKRMIKDLKE